MNYLVFEWIKWRKSATKGSDSKCCKVIYPSKLFNKCNSANELAAPFLGGVVEISRDIKVDEVRYFE